MALDGRYRLRVGRGPSGGSSLVSAGHNEFVKQTLFLGTLALLMTAMGVQCAVAQTPSSEEQPDKYQWLEDVSGKRSMEWVHTENERTAKILLSDPRFPAYQATALKALESPTRIPSPDFRNGEIYNFWQDAKHVQGILRRTTLSDYGTKEPHWKTVLDYDALSKRDHQKWVNAGTVSLYPNDEHILVGLSAGGEDAETLREFNLKTGSFVAHGFVLPRSKQDVTWVDKDTLLVARHWGRGTMTDSGYPFVIKLWKRGTPLSSAKEVFRGMKNDVGVSPFTLHDSQGHHAVVITRNINFFESEYFLWTRAGTKRIALPGKSEVDGLLRNQLIVTLDESWKPAGQGKTVPAGSVVALDLSAVRRQPSRLKPTVVFTPSALEFEQEVAVTRNHLLLTTLANVQGRAYVYTPTSGKKWKATKVPVSDNQTVGIVSTNESSDQYFLSLTGFLTPPSLMLGDAATGSLKLSKKRPPLFDAAPYVVQQLEATSKDGTRVPYFVVHRKDMKYDGSNPTLLNAYGGFQVSMTPYYSASVGKLWLEHGGVYVLANIRGGGEFGPAWHEAGLKTHRQRIYDDFYAVGENLIERKITSSKHLGIEGGSNGGLLMGVEMTQHPSMWNAVVIEVPLLDMLRFEKIAAGASWVGEYGSVSVPAERKFLASISPYNQLRQDVDYPEPFIFTTTKDDRVGPVHARKFAAKMEEFGKPFYYDEILEGGHGFGADLKEDAKSTATIYLYLTRKLMD